MNTAINITINIIAFLGSIFAFCMAIYTGVQCGKIKKMRAINKKIGSYIKDSSFLLMKNDGQNPCDNQKPLTIPKFSQTCDYIIRR